MSQAETEKVEQGAERVILPMICVCRSVDEKTQEISHARQDKADARRQQAYAALTHSETLPCTSDNFLSWALFFLDQYGAEVRFYSDQWHRVSASTQRFVRCGHAEGEHPEGCKTYHFEPELDVFVDCDRAEDGLAELVLWFKENRPEPDE